MQAQTAILPRIIGAIGNTDFPAVAARSVLDWLDFELAAVVVHRRDDNPGLMFDNFDAAHGTEGIRNYVAVTHRLNPVLQSLTHPGAFRARDYEIGAQGIGENVRPYLIRSEDEELGYRTVGWPARMEEIGLYFEAYGGVVELSFYRERGARRLSAGKLHDLAALGAPMAAAFDRQSVLGPREPPATALVAPLSRREAEIAGMLLVGCSSEAIALRLGISRYTVKDHRKQIFRKLGVGSLAELFALHRQLG
jgi:DNA-binding CsgD family transcriptional regulator